MTNTVYPANAVSGSPSYSGRALRQTTVAPFVDGATATRPLGARSGVRRGTPTTTVSATSTTWTVGPCAGVIDAESAAEAGPYAFSFDANQTGSMTAADATNPRVDVIYIRIDDPAESDGTSAPGSFVGYQAGTPAPSPVAPTSWTGSARSVVIAQINVPKAGTGSPSVTWVAPYLTAPGGVIIVRNQAERDAITYASAERPVYVDRLDTGNLERNVGSGWVVYARTASAAPIMVIRDANGNVMPAGKAPVIQSFVVQDTTDGTGSITVTFPQAFTAVPVVTATTVSGTAVAPVVNANVVSTTQVKLIWSGVPSTVIRTHVHAIGW